MQQRGYSIVGHTILFGRTGTEPYKKENQATREDSRTARLMSDLSQLFTCVQPTGPARAADTEGAAVTDDVGATGCDASQLCRAECSVAERRFR